MPQEGESPSLSAMWQVYHVPIALGSISLLFIVISVTIFIKSYQSVTPLEFRDDTREASETGNIAAKQVVIVDIEGAVVSPGVYKLEKGARINDLLVLVGGFTANADIAQVNKTVNRAAQLSDGAKLYIPFLDEQRGELPQHSEIISINWATTAELETLPGVGSVIAEKIIAGRPYLSLEELVQKDVMSEGLFTKCKALLML